MAELEEALLLYEATTGTAGAYTLYTSGSGIKDGDDAETLIGNLTPSGNIPLDGTNYSEVAESGSTTQKTVARKNNETTVYDGTDVETDSDGNIVSVTSLGMRSGVPVVDWASHVLKAMGVNADISIDSVKEKVKTWAANTLGIESDKMSAFTTAWQQIRIKTDDNTAISTVDKSIVDSGIKALYNSGIITDKSIAELSGSWTTPVSVSVSDTMMAENDAPVYDALYKLISQMITISGFASVSESVIENLCTNLQNAFHSVHPGAYLWKILLSNINTSYNTFTVSFQYSSDKVDGTIEAVSSTATQTANSTPQLTISGSSYNNATLGAVSSTLSVQQYSVRYSDGAFSYTSSSSSVTSVNFTGTILSGTTATKNFMIVSPEMDSSGNLTGKFKDINGESYDQPSDYTTAMYAFGYMNYNNMYTWTTRETETISTSTPSFGFYSLQPVSYVVPIETDKNYAGMTPYEFVHSSYHAMFQWIPGMTTKITHSDKTISTGFSVVGGATLPNEDDTTDTAYPGWVSGGTTHKRVVVDENGKIRVVDDTDLPLDTTGTATDATGARTGTKVRDYVTDTTDVTSVVSTDADVIEAVEEATDTVADDIVPTLPGGNVPIVTPTGTMSGGLWKAYNPSEAQIAQFGAWLWTSDPLEQIKKMFQDPMSAIISLHRIYVTVPEGTTETIKCGYLDSGVSSKTVSDRYVTVFLGSITIPNIYNNYTDYSEIDLTIFLPFIGMRKLDASICVGSAIGLTYRVDVFTGALVATMTVTKNNISGNVYQWSGSMIEQIPLTSSDMSSVIRGLLGVAASAVTTVATGGAAAPMIGVAAGAISQSHTDISACGSITGSTGALAAKVPYVIMTVPYLYRPYNYKENSGLPDNITIKLSSISGYAEIDEVDPGSSGSMTDSEYDEVISMIRSGVVL